MNNAATGVNVPLSTFGGLSTELSPSDLPEGGSPDNQDCAFLPGSVLTRPGLHRVYSDPPTSAAIVYSQSFTRKDGTVFNVLMDATGIIWSENRTAAPNVFTQVGRVPAGARCKSIDAFGRLFMTFSNGLRGVDIPRSFDGTKWNRVSQGGPCANPTFGEFISAAVALGNSASPASQAITSLASSGASVIERQVWVPITDLPLHYSGPTGEWETVLVTVYTTITITLASVAGFVANQTASITGNGGYNGTNLSIVAVDTVAKTVTITYNSETAVTGLGGTLAVTAPFLIRTQNIVTASTATAHGLTSGDMFTVSGVANTDLGGGIATVVRQNNVTIVTTSAANGVRVGSKVIISGVTDSSFNGMWTVTGVVSATAFQVESSNLVDATSSSGNVYGQWDNTQRFVISVPSSTLLTYEDIGPDAQTSVAGTITPVGQVAGGTRDAVCHFLTDYGFITPPSVPIQFTASGGKKIVSSNVPIGPSNVVARIISFTGVDGGNYFYIPVPARNNGNVISTSTVINDNISTSAIFDFSDQTLLSALAIDIDGNNLFNLKILGNCTGVFYYADRLLWLGDENKAINFQNMGFEGGVGQDGLPNNWKVTGTGLTVVTNADFGDGIEFAAGSNAVISQTCYLDYYGDQILEPSTQYTFKCWAKASIAGASVIAEIYDTNALAVIASAVIPVPASPMFISADFSALTPVNIPSSAVLRVYVDDNSIAIVTLDELSCIFTANPYNDTTFACSYINNPESVDAVTGIMGATADPSKIMDGKPLRDNFYFVTDNRLHTTKNSSSSEPSGWDVNEIASDCGSCSMFSMIEGEGWLGWASKDGARLFDGSQPIKITQDFQRFWDAINQSALTAIWSINDFANRRIYWGVPVNGSTLTNRIYMLDYRYAETGQAIEDRGAVRVSSYTGKMLVIELSRKFSPWNIPASAGGYLSTSQGKIPTFSDASGRTYWLDPNKYSDDDYGTMPENDYITSPFVQGELEQSLQLGNHRHFYSFLSMFVSGVGKLTITPLVDSLTNPWPARGPYTLNLNPSRSMEIPLAVSAERCFFRFSVTPLPNSTDAAFNISRMVVTMEQDPMSPVYGSR